MDRAGHRQAIEALLAELNAREHPYILKGGTSLMVCYGLDRFSEDIYFDAPARPMRQEEFRHRIDVACKSLGYGHRIAKNTETVSRAFVNYGDQESPLKIEVSYRRREIEPGLHHTVNGIEVYKLSEIASQKASAYQARDKIRDLYDVTWLVSERFDELDQAARDNLARALEYKDLDQFDYVVRTQNDPLIDVDALETRFLESFDKLGLLGPAGADKKGASIVDEAREA